jgi:hypothetical protein
MIFSKRGFRLALLLVIGPLTLFLLAAMTSTARFAAAAATKPRENDTGKWTAASTTAMSITGDITITPTSISFAHKTFKIRLVREIDKAHLDDAGRIADAGDSPPSARLYRIQIPRTTILLNENTMCGPNDAKWMLAVYEKKAISLAFFSGETEPNLDYQSVAVSHDLCGTYGYFARD